MPSAKPRALTRSVILFGALALRLARSPFADVVAAARSLAWTRDPFDRLIVAQAVAEQASLATRDRVIRRHFRGAIWD